MRTLYHATNPENAPSIWANGLLPSADGYVYLTEKIDDAVKFKSLMLSEMYIFPVKIKTPFPAAASMRRPERDKRAYTNMELILPPATAGADGTIRYP